MKSKCSICRFTCKSAEPLDCKFYPQEALLGYLVHINDTKNRTHESTSRMCVVCKDYFNLKKIRWIKQKEGLYPMCLECAKTHDFIVDYTPRYEVVK